MEELGAYGEQPDRAVTAVTPDATDPSFSQVTFNDGTMETMPTSQAEELPFESAPGAVPTPPYSADSPFGPPLPPPEAPAQEPASGGGGVPGAGMPPGGPMSPLGAIFGQARQASVETPLAPAAAQVGTGQAQPDMAEIVAPGSPGGFTPFSSTESSTAQESQ